MIRKFNLIIVMLVFIVLGFVSWNVQADDDLLRVGATPQPHAEILKLIKQDLAQVGVEIEIVEFTDYVTPNIALADRSIDANFFQHIPYLNQFNSDRNLNLTYTVKVHLEPYGLYSKEIIDLSQLPDGALIALPNDPSNEARALQLLHREGIIELKDAQDLKATPLDIIKNPKNIKFKELSAAQLPRVLPDVTAVFINTNYALEAGLNPREDAILLEDKESPYANVLAVRKGEEEIFSIRMLSRFLNSKKVKDYILKEYKGAILPAF